MLWKKSVPEDLIFWMTREMIGIMVNIDSLIAAVWEEKAVNGRKWLLDEMIAVRNAGFSADFRMAALLSISFLLRANSMNWSNSSGRYVYITSLARQLCTSCFDCLFIISTLILSVFPMHPYNYHFIYLFILRKGINNSWDLARAYRAGRMTTRLTAFFNYQRISYMLGNNWSNSIRCLDESFIVSVWYRNC